MDSTQLAALAPVIILIIGLQLYCLMDLRKAHVRYLPKWGWAVALIMGGVLLNVLYLTAGRQHE